jgi:hypothetical protein
MFARLSSFVVVKPERELITKLVKFGLEILFDIQDVG